MATSSSLHMDMRDLKWSPAEKSLARKVFERALDEELQETMAEAKRRAAKIRDPQELWELEEYLTKRGQQIDRKYDYRYSVLPMVFGILIREGRLQEKDLDGLQEDKLEFIKRWATA